jgi:chromosome segregation protein
MFQSRLLCLAVLVLAFAAISTSAKPSSAKRTPDSAELEELEDELSQYVRDKAELEAELSQYAKRLTQNQQDDLAKYQAASSKRLTQNEQDDLAKYQALSSRDKAELEAELSQLEDEKRDKAELESELKANARLTQNQQDALAKYQALSSRDKAELEAELSQYVRRRNQLRRDKAELEAELSQYERSEDSSDEGTGQKLSKYNALASKRLTQSQQDDLAKYQAASNRDKAELEAELSQLADEKRDKAELEAELSELADEKRDKAELEAELSAYAKRLTQSQQDDLAKYQAASNRRFAARRV